MDINFEMRKLRVNARQSYKEIMKDVIERHVPKINSKDKSKKEICIFCGAKDNLTKEHVLPKWTFGRSTEEFFKTGINGNEQTYNKTTIPACAECNNNRLSNIENYIVNLFKNKDLNTSFFKKEDVQNIIRWLEIIEYKFQVLEIRRKFIKAKEAPYLSFLRDIPISIMRENIGYSPYKAIAEIRLSQKKITKKCKKRNENSLIIFKTKNQSFYFFHQMNDFIFIELPEYKIAIFYFYNKIFEEPKKGYDEAFKIIESVYNT